VIVLKTPDELHLMHQANALVHEVLDLVAAAARPGVTTKQLDEIAERRIRERGAVPAFKGYRGYPATLCTSVNDVIVHGIPSGDCRLREGDILSVDCGVLWSGFYGDAAVTVAIGQVADDAARLLETTRECLELAVAAVKPGRRLTDVGDAVQRHAEGAGFSVVREFVGHGVGRSLHEEPQVYNFGPPGRGPELRPGLVLAIEPMINAGRPGVVIDDDGWTARTEDGKLAAHFEYSVAVTADGPWVLGVDGGR
jgi:methionyl aminopeptidase